MASWAGCHVELEANSWAVYSIGFAYKNDDEEPQYSKCNIVCGSRTF